MLMIIFIELDELVVEELLEMPSLLYDAMKFPVEF